MFSVCYPAIYATENRMLNETTQTNEVTKEETNLEKEEIKEEVKEEILEETPVEEVSEEKETPSIETAKNEVQEVQTPQNAIVNQTATNEVQEPTIEIVTPQVRSAMPEKQENKAVTTQEKAVKQTTPAGRLYIDTPTHNQNYEIGTNQIKISGWAVANTNNVSLRLYLNNWLWAEIYDRSDRGDINSIAAEYDSVTTKAGFSKELDISSWGAGTHTIRIDQVSNDGKVIGSDSRTIKIAKKEYAGRLYIDTPINNQNYEIGTSKLKITGWAVANDTNISLKLYLDNWLWTEIYDRSTRGDINAIAANYGGVTKKAGFSKELDISSWGAGTHTIRIDQVSREGKVIGSDSRTIKIAKKEYAGTMYLETPTDNQVYHLPDANKIKVSGWAVSNDEKAVVKMYINGGLWAEFYERTERGDLKSLAANYGGVTKKAGFSKEININNWNSGTYTIKVEQVSRTGKVLSSTSKKIKISQAQYEGRMYIDSPSNNATYQLPDTKKIKIDGWAVSNDKNAYIFVIVDGKECSYTVTRTARGDIDRNISPAYGGVANTPKAGFSINLDISNLKDGKHTIEVMEVSRLEKILVRTALPINISTPNYAGMMNIDSPIQNKRYRSGWLEVSGWAITESKNDYVEIYLDGKYATKAARQKRPDVVGVYQGQYGVNANSTPGFYSQLHTANLGEGTHTVKVIHYSGYGKKIQEREVKFIISNTTTWGIDVSHYQETIDWNAVKNQGVNFALLKIGEYHESTHSFVLDGSFNKHYAACKQHGIAVGGYIYSYEFNADEARNEANACLAAISGKSFEMPIFLDIEDNRIANAITTGKTTVDAVTNGAVTFCNMMNQHGYQSGVYANKTFFTRYLNASVLEQYNIWLAHYTNAASSDYPGKYDIWQYTSSGSVPGINGPVDLNWCFKRYY